MKANASVKEPQTTIDRICFVQDRMRSVLQTLLFLLNKKKSVLSLT